MSSTRDGHVSDAVIVSLDRRTAIFLVDVPPALATALRERGEARRPKAGSRRRPSDDAGARRAAQAVLRWRLDLELFAFQAREASP